jgi:hypothetical protein
VAADPSPPSSPIVSHEYELPSARQVVGRGLQLALDSSADIRRTSLYIGLLVAGVAAPAAVLLLASLPTLLALPWDDLNTMTPGQARALNALFGPLYGAITLAAFGVISILLDGQLMVTAQLAGRLAGAPVTMREALARSRQVFWRYGAAAFAVGLLSGATNLVVSLLTGTFGRGESIGSSLLATFVAAIVTAPFGYVLMGVVAGDVSAGTALRRSVALARVRPALAAAVAAFAFVSSILMILGIGVAVDVVADIGLVVNPDIGSDSAAVLLSVPITTAAFIAYGSLSVTVAAIAVAPQVAAFLGLTHYAAGLDRARSTALAEPAATGSPIWATPTGIRPARWVTIPMAVLIGVEALLVASALAAGR